MYIKKNANNTISRIIINYSVCGIALFCSSYIIINNKEKAYFLMFLLPIFFAICFVVILSKSLFSHFRMFNTVYIGICALRYMILPSMIVLTGRYNGRSPVFPEDKSFNLAFILMIYELIVSSICIYLLDKKMIKKYGQIGQFAIDDNLIFLPKSIFIYSIFGVFTFFLLFLYPEALSLFNLLSPNEGTKQIYDLPISTEITAYSLLALKQILFILILTFCWKKYRQTESKTYIVFSVFLVLINSVIYMGLNRSDFLMALIASAALFCIFYKKYTKVIIVAALILIIIVIPAVTMTRNVQLASKGTDTLIDITDFLQIYLGGPYNVAISVETAEYFPNSRNLYTLFYDFFRPVPLLNIILEKLPLKISSFYFNERIFFNSSRSQIIPMIGEGYFFLGAFFAPAINIIFILIAYKFYEMIIKVKSPELIYFLTLQCARLGFMMGQSASIQMNDLSFNLLIPIVVYWLNKKIVLKRERKNFDIYTSKHPEERILV